MVFSLSLGLAACGGGSADTEQQVQENEQVQTESTEQNEEQNADTENEAAGSENAATGSETETTVTEGETAGTENSTAGQENTEAAVQKELKKASELNKADYEQLTSLMKTVEEFGEKFTADNAAMTEQIKMGNADTKECAEKYKAYIEEANAIMSQISAVEWETEDCEPYLTLLAQGIGSLRAAGELSVQVVELENAAELIAVADTYFKAYTENIASLYKGLGI